MFFRAAYLFVALTLVSAGDPVEDSKDALYVKAFQPGSSGDTLSVKCTFDRSKTGMASVTKLEIFAADVDDEDNYGLVAAVTGYSASSNMGESTVTVEGEISTQRKKKSKLTVTWVSANSGYCKIYKCVATGPSAAVFLTKKVKTADGSKCSSSQAQENSEQLEALESKVDECCSASQEGLENSANSIQALTQRVDALQAITADAESNAQKVNAFTSQVGQLSNVPASVQSNTAKIEALRQIVAAFSQKIGSEAAKLAGQVSALQSKVDALTQKEAALGKLMALDKNKFHVSDINNGRVYIARKAIEPFNQQTKNEECKRAGGYLVEFDNLAEQTFVGRFVSTLGNAWYFTGGNDVAIEGKWVYFHSKKPMTGIKWRGREPNSYGGNEDCVDVNIHGLNDNRCNNNGKYVCEIPLV